MKKIIGDACHDYLTKQVKQELAFSPEKDFNEWKGQVEQKLFELLGMDKIEKNVCPLNIEIEEDVTLDGYRRIRFTFESEKESIVPCYLLIPNTGKEKYPLAIMLQGHTSGFHVSIGVSGKDINDHLFMGSGEYPDRNYFGLQAVKNGFAALCIEQRGFGERVTSRHGFWEGACQFAATHALMLGRTIIGERVWDVSRAIDAMSNFDMVDTSFVMVAGHSGGGTATFYSACYDKRIKLAVVAGAFCTYEHSIMAVRHCVCNYIPHAYENFDMGDLTCLIAPRKLIVCGGVEDEGFPKEGVEIAINTAKQVFEKAGVPENCRFESMPCAHEWRESIIWNAINEEVAKIKKGK